MKNRKTEFFLGSDDNKHTFHFFKNPSIRYAAVSIFIFMLPYTVLKNLKILS